IFTIAACPDQRLPRPPGSPCAAGPPSIRPNRPAARASARSAAARPVPGTPAATSAPSTTCSAPVCSPTPWCRSPTRRRARRSPDLAARSSLLALLLTFLHDHGRCVWRYAGMPAPGRLAVVPTGCGRPGPHPLLELVAPYLRLPVTGLVIRPGEQGRDPNLD